MNLETDFIISNYKWLYHNQIFMDYIGQKKELSDIIDKLAKLPNITITADINTIIKHNFTHYKNIFDILNKLYNNSNNKNTYIPLLTGLYLLEGIFN